MSDLTGGTGVIDVTPAEAWSVLSTDPNAALIDVRTAAEWTFVGTPNLSSAGKRALLIEWQVFPSMDVNTSFVSQLNDELVRAGLPKDTPLYFLCRSGVRSKAAALAMASAGWTHGFNIAGGFEGGPDASGHRGAIAGWKASNLPWVQS